jgi:O-antigen ligase
MYRSINSEGKVAHNSYLSVLVELGLVGFGLFALTLVIAASQAWIQPKWESRFWFALLMVWGIGAATLTWEHRKSTWLFLSLLVVGAALARQRAQAQPQVQADQPTGQLLHQAQ